MELSACSSCGWVHFVVSREHAEKEVVRFNEYFNKLGDKEKYEYYGGKPSSIVSYQHCFCCGNSYKEFVDYDVNKHNNINGHTLSPIMRREE